MSGFSSPRFSPATLIRARHPFDHPDFLFELKHDGWRAMAYLHGDRCELVSRRGNAFKSFAQLRTDLAKLARTAILDGENSFAWTQPASRRFYDLMRHGGEPVFYAFDVLGSTAKDLRGLPTIERKQILENPVRDQRRILYASHYEARGVDPVPPCVRTGLGRNCLQTPGRAVRIGKRSLGEGCWTRRTRQREGRHELFRKAGHGHCERVTRSHRNRLPRFVKCEAGVTPAHFNRR
jgi:hypothetical protein